MTGIFKSLIEFYFDFTRILNTYKTFLDDISKNLFKLYISNIDFLPTEMLKDNKIIDWLASNLMKVMKF